MLAFLFFDGSIQNNLPIVKFDVPTHPVGMLGVAAFFGNL
jgi:hypothetical protein